MKLPIPQNLNCPEFQDVWELWHKHRAEIRHPLTPTCEAMQLKKLARWSVNVAVEAVETSICNGWQGLWPEKVNGSKRKKTKLYPIKIYGETKNCSECGVPAVYKSSGGAYDYYYCANCMPERVKAQFE